MNINPLWLLCLFVRISLIFIIWKLNKIKNTKYSKIIKLLTFIIILSMGLGFIGKGYFGSNDEIQIAKVFWHETRYVHGIIYILSSLYLLNDNLNICLLLLFLDVVFSLLYRIIFDK
jgi:hypothetical protein